MPIAGQRVGKHIPTEASAQNSRSMARQWRGKQALSTTQAVFSMGSVQSGYKRVHFQSWQLWKNANEENEKDRENENENVNGASLRQSIIVRCCN
jgi:hypothetical protein